LIAEETAATPFVALDLGEVEMGDDSPVDNMGSQTGPRLARNQREPTECTARRKSFAKAKKGDGSEQSTF
jgi:hypothetical protein